MAKGTTRKGYTPSHADTNTSMPAADPGRIGSTGMASGIQSKGSTSQVEKLLGSYDQGNNVIKTGWSGDTRYTNKNNAA